MSGFGLMAAIVRAAAYAGVASNTGVKRRKQFRRPSECMTQSRLAVDAGPGRGQAGGRGISREIARCGRAQDCTAARPIP